MRLAIHHRPGSFSEEWIKYCKFNLIPYKIVNCYESNIIQMLEDCDGLLWHHHHHNYKDVLFAKQLLYSLQLMGKITFPDFNTNWHFDDKIGQKYLLEAIGAATIPTHIFYDKKSATNWVNNTNFPKVFKLRGGSGSRNVSLIKSKSEALKKINKAFGKGFPQFDRVGNLIDRYKKYKSGQDSFVGLLRGVARLFYQTEYSKMLSREKGYIYFQDFMPENTYDIRLIVIKDKAYGMKRLNRKGDFRASGSSMFVYDDIPKEVLTIAFEVSYKLKLQSVAFDFVFNEKGDPVIVEMSYVFGTTGSNKCKGYWTPDGIYHEGNITPQVWIIENLISEINSVYR